ncbi:MAG: TlpA disulfide reductase family protein [Mycobacterium sp.]|uniref:TlpA family protein disulfide reductase n=1 Tax=Mycobacterium sp. TaxID=1785 RepID=UPI00262B3981|nr:TlpA disulfide reductase family protein [Mycobacterium sp.]MDI3313373.1 TlpA disulfide reductase family protein [Mycobacterium sp.]
MTTSNRTPAVVCRRGVGPYLQAVAAAVLAIGAAAACGPSTSPSPTGAGKPAATHATSGPVTLTTVDGKQVTVPGRVPTALFFFSVAGCEECLAGGKSFAQAAAKTPGGKAAFLAVDMDPSDPPQKATDFLGQVGAPTLPAVIDKGAVLTGRFQVTALSTLIVVDPAGKVTYRATGPSADQITTALRQAGAGV